MLQAFRLNADMHTGIGIMLPGQKLGSRKYPGHLRTLQGVSSYKAKPKWLKVPVDYLY